MAKKVVASLQKRGAKDFTKAIKNGSLNKKKDSYQFKEAIVAKDQLKSFFEKQ